jgi:hypothetical protein
MRLAALILTAALFLTSGCATAPFPATVLTATAPVTAAELVAGLWSSQRGSLMVRQSALFEFRGMKVPVAGMMKLDPARGEARLVGMNDMGVKLYDISVDRIGSQANFVMPEFSKYPGFADAVALSVRRIYLAPLPSAGDRLERTPKSYLLTREEGGRIRFTVGGAERQLLEKEVRGAEQSWRVDYYQYRSREGISFPDGIVLEDERSGYRLTLWTEGLEKADE